MKKFSGASCRFCYTLNGGSIICIYNIGKILAQEEQVHLLAINEGGIADEHLRKLEEIFNKGTRSPHRRL